MVSKIYLNNRVSNDTANSAKFFFIINFFILFKHCFPATSIRMDGRMFSPLGGPADLITPISPYEGGRKEKRARCKIRSDIRNAETGHVPLRTGTLTPFVLRPITRETIMRANSRAQCYSREAVCVSTIYFYIVIRYKWPEEKACK